MDPALQPTPIFYPGSTTPRRPSDVWYEGLGWIDGASNPPIYFYTTQDKLAALQYYWPDDPRIPELEATLDPPPYREPPPPPQAPTTNTSPSLESQPPLVGPGAPGVLLGPSDLVPSMAAPSTAIDPSVEIPAPVPTERSGFRITVTMKWTSTDEATPSSRSSSKAVAPKKMQENKSMTVDLKNITREDFIIAFLRSHDQHDRYKVGPSGPPFKLWYTGCGAKANAITIDNNEEFDDCRKAILGRTRDTAIVVEFDVDQWVPFRARKRVHDDDDDTEEVVSGTKVPRVDNYTEDERLHGRFILILKKKWGCQAHLGEHGDPGFCYVDANGKHFGLNMRRLKFWAMAMAAGDAYVEKPPNNCAFDGPRDGHVTLTTPRGRNGPYRALEFVQPPPPPPPPAVVPEMSLLMTAMAARLIGGELGGLSVPSTPKKPVLAQTPVYSPVPTRNSELHACLSDFRSKEGVDLMGVEGKLSELRFAPTVIPRVSVQRLIEVTGAVEGDVIFLQDFCEKWCARLEEKKRNLA